MSLGFGISDFEYVFKLGQRVLRFFKDVKGAPDDFKALKAEADCLSVCLKVLEYPDSRAVLAMIPKKMAKDLHVILEGCELNMAELNKFVAVSKRVIMDSVAKKGGGGGKRRWMKQMWAKFKFVWKGTKQPMREKLAIPTQSLNIFLVSLTFVSYRSVKFPQPWLGGQRPSSFKGMENWDVVGLKTAFKDADFRLSELRQPGIEEDVVAYAIYIINGGTSFKGKGATGKGAAKPSGGASKLPRRTRRKSAFGRGMAMDPDGLYLARPKKPGRSRSRSRLVSSVEVVKADHEFDSGSESDFEPYDDGYLSPSQDPHSPRNYVSYETREPKFGSFERVSEDYRGRRPNEVHVEEREYLHDEEDLQEVKHKGFHNACKEIKKERKEAIREMKREMKEEESRTSHARRRSSAPSPTGEIGVDVRSFLEIRYGIIIDYCSTEEAHINASRARCEEEEEVKFRRTLDVEEMAHSFSSESSDSDSGPALELKVSGAQRRSRVRIEKESFAIPRTEYIPRTEGFETPQTSTDRESSIRERERSLREREMSLRERELALREREQRFFERQHPARHREMPPVDELGRPVVFNNTVLRSRSPEVEEYPERRPTPRRPGRSASYAGPDHTELVRDDSFERRNNEREYRRPEVRRERDEIRRSRADSDDSDGDESVNFISGPRGR